MKQKLLQIYFNIFGFLARRYIKKYKPKVIGFTGSIGKTTARMIVYHILSSNLDKKVYTSQKNFNGELGMSLSILGINKYTPNLIGVIKTLFYAFFISYFGTKKYDIILLEYGIDHPKEMDFLLSIVKPDISIVTKIDKVHSKQFGTKEKIALEKYKLSKNTKEICFLNYDDDFAKSYFDIIDVDKYFYTSNYGLKSNEINLSGENYKLENNHSIKSNYDLYFNSEKVLNITSNLIGDENIGYINIGCFILNEFLNGDLFLDYKKLNFDFIIQPSRMSIFQGIKDSILVDSTYNAAPESMKKVITNTVFLRDLLFVDYKIIFVLGDLRELGEYEKKEHEDLASFVYQKADKFFLVGESMNKYFIPMFLKLTQDKDRIKHFNNSKNLGKELLDYISNSKDKYIILFKGSQNTIFLEEALKLVLKNNTDEKNICRQDKYWISKKLEFFKKNV